MTSKAATILTRTEPETKQAADAIFARLGMTTSGAINIFLHQSIERQGLPFEVRLATPNIPNLDNLSTEELKSLIAESRNEISAGHSIDAKSAFAKLRAEYGL
ncbi:type II toxin-antitoxin system RelB/DinJ family antitoxin [Candidatus Saccharibacteria bacterium]|nr:type II toxin-antitoxin system RelB/DinJ family antitoxin [Candidatus Saccharibacteria bacterium]